MRDVRNRGERGIRFPFGRILPASSFYVIAFCALAGLIAPVAVQAQDSQGSTDTTEIDSLFDVPDETGGGSEGESSNADDIDSLFDEADTTGGPADGDAETEADVNQGAEDGGEGDHGGEAGAVDIGALTTSPTEISARVRANLGIGVGLIEWPGSDAAAGRDVDDLMRYSGLYGSGATMSVDTRPTSYLRFRTSVGTSLDTDTMGFSDPSVGEFFVDYTFRDTLFVRGGKQGLTWGQGRILGNPANLVSNVSDGIAVRGTLPVGRGTTTALVYGRQEWVAARGETSPEAYGYAGQIEQTFDAFSFGVHGHFHIDEEVKGALTLGWGKDQVNLASDVVVFWDRDQPFGSDSARLQGMGQLFWNSADEDWIFGVEYQFDSDVRDDEGDYVGHRTGIAVRTPGLFGTGWRPSITWQHADQDDSGQIVAAIGGTIAPSLRLSIGVPVIYGQPGTYYRDALAEDAAEDEEDRDEDAIPLDNVVSVLLGFSLSFSF